MAFATLTLIEIEREKKVLYANAIVPLLFLPVRVKRRRNISVENYYATNNTII